MTAEVVRMHTIQRVMNEFFGWRASSLDPEELVTYRETIAFFEGSINAHAVPALGDTERRIYRAYYERGKGYRRLFSEVFGPEKIPAEIRHFLRRFLGKTISADIDVLERAPTVVADLCSWLVWKGYIPESEMEAAIDELGAQAFSEQQDSVNV